VQNCKDECAQRSRQHTIKLRHFLTETEVLANHCLKLWLMYQRCKPPINILERLAELRLKNLQSMYNNSEYFYHRTTSHCGHSQPQLISIRHSQAELYNPRVKGSYFYKLTQVCHVRHKLQNKFSAEWKSTSKWSDAQGVYRTLKVVFHDCRTIYVYYC